MSPSPRCENARAAKTGADSSRWYPRGGEVELTLRRVGNKVTLIASREFYKYRNLNLIASSALARPRRELLSDIHTLGATAWDERLGVPHITDELSKYHGRIIRSLA